MATTVLSRPGERAAPGLTGARTSLIVALIIWLLLVVSLGALGAFIGPRGQPPVGMAVGVAAPLLVFLAWLRLSGSFRELVLSLDLGLIAGMQAWRWAGLGFLFLYAYKVLPGVFALPAGLGDMAIGVTAPWIAFALARQPGFAASPAFTRWNLLGILDLVVALSIGTASAMLSTGAPGEVSTAQMATLPLVLVPAFLVPFFLMLHAAALMQSRRCRREPTG